MRPVVLPPNAVPRFYRGGPAIAALRGSEPVGDHVPEDWIGSMTTVFGEKELGLSRLPDGRLLRDAAAADPVAFFGPEHAARHGADPGMLVKLLDAGERLPVHVHPDEPGCAGAARLSVRQDRGLDRRSPQRGPTPA